MIDSKVQREILSNCSFFSEGAKYAEMKVADIDNDLYNYHLQHLVSKDYLVKDVENIYHLTEKGKSIVTNIHEDSHNVSTNYKVSVYMCAVKDGKILLHKRLKHPQYGYIGLPSGKIKYGERILYTARREFKEETELVADFKIIGNLHQIRRNEKGEVIEDGVFYVCYADEFEGTLLERQKEGENFWVELEKVSTLEKLFKPSLEFIVEKVMKRISGEISWDLKFIEEFEPEPEEY